MSAAATSQKGPEKANRLRNEHVYVLRAGCARTVAVLGSGGLRKGKAETAVCVHGELGKTGYVRAAGGLKLQREISDIFILFYY